MSQLRSIRISRPYDIVKGESIIVDRPDILIFEGINVLLPNRLPRDGKEIPFVSDFFDFSIFLDAETTLLEQWYIERFMSLRDDSVSAIRAAISRHIMPTSTMRRPRRLRCSIWRRINLVNSCMRIFSRLRPRADLLLTKGASHRIEEVALRKL